MRKKMVCICVALLTALSASQMVATAENMTVAPNFDPVENAQLNETVGDTDGCTAVIDDITLEELVASGEPLPIAENVGESSFTIGLARDASVHVMTSSDEGWVRSGSYWYYYDSLGNMVTGWLKDGTGSSATWYFCNTSNGRMISNQVATIDGNLFYFQSSGAMKTGWQQINGNWWYFTPYGQSAPEGSAVNGRVSIGSEIYYFRNYIMQHGKQYITTSGFLDGYYYFGNPGDEDSGCMMYGWLHDTEVSSNTWYYLGTNGLAYTGWHIISGTTYHFDSHAEMSYGNIRMGYSDFEFDSSGAFINDEPYPKGDPMWGTAELNLRWNNLVIDNYGHRIPTLRVAQDNLPSNMAEAFDDMVDYYNSLQDDSGNGQLVDMINVSSLSSADVIVYTRDILRWMFSSSAAGVTFLGNADNQWTNESAIPSQYQDIFPEQEMGLFYTGKAKYGLIALQTAYITSDSITKDKADYLIRHEMGHVLGLRHPWETSDYADESYYPQTPDALMWPVVTPDCTVFFDYDYEEFYKTYPQEEDYP